MAAVVMVPWVCIPAEIDAEVNKVDGNDVDCKFKNSATRFCSHLMPPKFILIFIFSPKNKQPLSAAGPPLLPCPLFVASAAVAGHHQVSDFLGIKKCPS
nr:hypothetical protein [Tanacetum cinerariifolium]